MANLIGSGAGSKAVVVEDNRTLVIRRLLSSHA
jgi:hypothetical protein